MSLYDVLLKSNIIDFEKILLDKYSEIDLDETDVIVLIKIYQFMKSNDYLDSDKISEKMHISSKEVSTRIINLAERNFISIDMDSSGKEIVKIDGIINALEKLLANDQKGINEDNEKNTIKLVCDYATKSFCKVMSSIDLQLINHWIKIDKYSFEQVKNAIDECVIKNKTALKYADAILNSKHIEVAKNIDLNLQEKFNNVLKRGN